jgi:hypothetical protein
MVKLPAGISTSVMPIEFFLMAGRSSAKHADVSIPATRSATTLVLRVMGPPMESLDSAGDVNAE